MPKLPENQIEKGLAELVQYFKEVRASTKGAKKELSVIKQLAKKAQGIVYEAKS